MGVSAAETVKTAIVSRVDRDVSDLFFNLDFDQCKVMEKEQFVGWDEARLREEADWFTKALANLGVSVDIDDLIADFHARV